MQITQLEYLVDLSETYSITNTAKRFYITQQAVSNSIKSLELELGVQLLNRSKKGVTFTPEGNLVLKYARKMLMNLDDMKQNIIGEFLTEETDYRKIFIYSSSVIGYLLNAMLISIAEKTFKNISIRCFYNENNSYNLISNLSNEKCDICLITLNEEAFEVHKNALEEKNLSYTILKKDAIVACCNSLFKDDLNGNIITENSNICLLHLTELKSMSNFFWEHAAKSIVRTDDILSAQDMLRTVGTIAYMPRTTFENFFGSTKYTAYCIPNITLVHVAIYHNNTDPIIQEIVRLIEKEVARL